MTIMVSVGQSSNNMFLFDLISFDLIENYWLWRFELTLSISVLTQSTLEIIWSLHIK